MGSSLPKHGARIRTKTQKQNQKEQKEKKKQRTNYKLAQKNIEKNLYDA